MFKKKKRIIIVISILIFIFIIIPKLYEFALIKVAENYLIKVEYPYKMQFERIGYSWLADPARHFVYFSKSDNPEHILYVSVNHDLTITDGRGDPIVRVGRWRFYP